MEYHNICIEINERASILDEMQNINERLGKIDAVAGILDDNLRRILVILRRCATMEVMPFEEREKSLAFSNAMTALEGFPASEETKKNLSLWVVGESSFQDSYLKTLRAYHLAEV